MADDELRGARQRWAKAALGEHEKAYGRPIAGRLRSFWEASDGWKYQQSTLKAKLPGFDDKRWQLKVAPPSWAALSEASLDDGVVGPQGDWKKAGDFLPLFVASSESGDGFVVASLADPHAVGFFHEENWESNGKGFKDGVFVLAPSLDKFLKDLSPARKAKGEDDDESDPDDDDEGLWSAADGDGDEGGGGDEDEAE